MELWKDITGYEGCYQVSNQGRVKSLLRKTPIILKQAFNNRQYLIVCLAQKTEKVHRLVAQTFVPNPDNLPLVMHLDDNPLNNNDCNLKWGTHQDNMDDMYKKGRQNQSKGEKQHLSKLIEQQVLEIREKYIPIIYSTTKLAKEFNVNQSTIERIVNRKTWKHI